MISRSKDVNSSSVIGGFSLGSWTALPGTLPELFP
jgi:hypothetical protein